MKQLLPVTIRLVALDRLSHEASLLVQLSGLRKFVHHHEAFSCLTELVQVLEYSTSLGEILGCIEARGSMLKHLNLLEKEPGGLEVLLGNSLFLFGLFEELPLLSLTDVLVHFGLPYARLSITHFSSSDICLAVGVAPLNQILIP